jgi:hypothetical protein
MRPLHSSPLLRPVLDSQRSQQDLESLFQPLGNISTQSKAASPSPSDVIKDAITFHLSEKHVHSAGMMVATNDLYFDYHQRVAYHLDIFAYRPTTLDNVY